jgi:hypothetical protein
MLLECDIHAILMLLHTPRSQQYPTSPQESYGGPQMHPIQQQQQPQYNQQPVNPAAYDNQAGYNNNNQQQQGYPQQDAPLAGPGGYQDGGVGAGFANGGSAGQGDMNAFFGEVGVLSCEVHPSVEC